MNGTLDPSEQFAIDWIKVDRQGKAFRTDGKRSEDWLCYGVDVLAVADGTVVEAMRDLPDQPPGAAPRSLTIPEIAGNHVILDLGGGRYAMYAHLAPGSVTVHVGDHIRAGDKLGLGATAGTRPVHTCTFRSAIGRPRWIQRPCLSCLQPWSCKASSR
jgi:hypothetical protein